MKLLSLTVAVLVLGIAFPATAQVPRDLDPAVVNPTSIKVLLENDSVRVMDAVLPPGYKERLHRHPPYVMYILSGGKVRLNSATGQTRDSEFTAGDVFYSDGVTHWAENTGTSTIRVLLVEMRTPEKNKSPPAN